MLACSGRDSTGTPASEGRRRFPVPSEKAQSIFGVSTRFPALVAQRPERIAFGDGGAGAGGDGADGCACRGVDAGTD